MTSSVIQHTYTDQPDLFINHYFLKEKKFEAHIHDGYEIGTIISGKGIFRYDNGINFVYPGDSYFVDCRVPHAHYPVEGYHLEILFVHIKNNTLSSLAPHDQFLDLLSPFMILRNGYASPLIHDSLSVSKNIIQAKKSYTSSDRFGYFTAWPHIINALIEINREISRIDTMNHSTIDRYQILVQHIVSYIERNFTKELSLKQIADYCNISSSGLSKLFNDIVGISPIKYRNKLRIDKSLVLLKTTTESIESIAYSCGFQDIANFRRIFKNNNGKLPSDFRK